MSRSGYTDDCEHLFLWRGAVRRAINGKRGQAFLREMRSALDALPEKRLARNTLVDPKHGCCAMGAVAIARGVDVSHVDPQDTDDVSRLMGIAPAMAAEIAYENDEGSVRWYDQTPEQRWQRMSDWVDSCLRGEFNG